MGEVVNLRRVCKQRARRRDEGPRRQAGKIRAHACRARGHGALAGVRRKAPRCAPAGGGRRSCRVNPSARLWEKSSNIRSASRASTSISLEWAFWDELKGIANACGQPIANLSRRSGYSFCTRRSVCRDACLCHRRGGPKVPPRRGQSAQRAVFYALFGSCAPATKQLRLRRDQPVKLDHTLFRISRLEAACQKLRTHWIREA